MSEFEDKLQSRVASAAERLRKMVEDKEAKESQERREKEQEAARLAEERKIQRIQACRDGFEQFKASVIAACEEHYARGHLYLDSRRNTHGIVGMEDFLEYLFDEIRDWAVGEGFRVIAHWSTEIDTICSYDCNGDSYDPQPIYGQEIKLEWKDVK